MAINSAKVDLIINDPQCKAAARCPNGQPKDHGLRVCFSYDFLVFTFPTPCEWRFREQKYPGRRCQQGHVPSHKWCRERRWGPYISVRWQRTNTQKQKKVLVLGLWHMPGTAVLVWFPIPCSCGSGSSSPRGHNHPLCVAGVGWISMSALNAEAWAGSMIVQNKKPLIVPPLPNTWVCIYTYLSLVSSGCVHLKKRCKVTSCWCLRKVHWKPLHGWSLQRQGTWASSSN